MMRFLSSLSNWYLRAFFALILLSFFVSIPLWAIFIPLVLYYVFPSPKADNEPPRHSSAPVTGRWVAVNSPATKVPSHIRFMGQSHAIDILLPEPVDEKPAIGWELKQRRAEDFASYGEPVHAAADGTVIAVHDGKRDHRARNSWPGLIYMLTVEAIGRSLGGTSFIVGNHVIIDQHDGSYALYAHLRRGSVAVRVGDQLKAAAVLGEVGNSGNSSEPHLHFQLMDHPKPEFAAGLPFRWDGIDIEDAVSRRWSGGKTPEKTIPGLPANGQIFTVTDPAGSDHGPE